MNSSISTSFFNSKLDEGIRKFLLLLFNMDILPSHKFMKQNALQE